MNTTNTNRPKRFATMTEWRAATAWDALAKLNATVGQKFGPFAVGHLTEYGVVETVLGTGRARCRACGHKIAAGVPAVRFQMDIGGCGSWTCTTSHIHMTPCLPAAGGIERPAAE